MTGPMSGRNFPAEPHGNPQGPRSVSIVRLTANLTPQKRCASDPIAARIARSCRASARHRSSATRVIEMTLWSEFLTHQGSGMSKWKQYFPAYQRHLSKFIDQSILLVEIGVSGGGSLQLWKKFLGPFVRIVGIDNDVTCKQFEEDQISVRLGSQSDFTFLQSVVEEFGGPDIVIDDGSHRSEDQINAFQFFYPLLTKNGVYAIEDLHVAYWDLQAGLVPHGKSTIDLCKSLVDDLHGRYSRDKRSTFTDTTRSISFYDSLVIFERGIVQNLYAPVIGTDDGNPGIVIDSKGLRVLDAGESVPQDT